LSHVTEQLVSSFFHELCMTSKKGLSHFVLIYVVIIFNKTFSFAKRLKSKTYDRNGLSTSAKWYGSCIVIVGWLIVWYFFLVLSQFHRCSVYLAQLDISTSINDIIINVADVKTCCYFMLLTWLLLVSL